MTFITLTLFAACFIVCEAEAQLHAHGVLASRASGRLEVWTVLAYRGTGRLGCYRASERG